MADFSMVTKSINSLLSRSPELRATHSTDEIYQYYLENVFKKILKERVSLKTGDSVIYKFSIVHQNENTGVSWYKVGNHKVEIVTADYTVQIRRDK